MTTRGADASRLLGLAQVGELEAVFLARDRLRLELLDHRSPRSEGCASRAR